MRQKEKTNTQITTEILKLLAGKGLTVKEAIDILYTIRTDIEISVHIPAEVDKRMQSPLADFIREERI